MKREGWLIERMAERGNLREAYVAARRGTRPTAERVAFGKSLEENLERLRVGFLGGDLDFGPYRRFRVTDPKERVISVAPFRDRVAHHAMMRVCDPAFERYAIPDSFACRRGKGLHACIRRAQELSRRYRFFMKLDIRHYFDCVPHAGVLESLRRLFRDERFLLVAERLLESHDLGGGRGLPIGNLTSQHFANHYLARFDHWAKEDLRAPGYVRYMDDFVLWGRDRGELRAGLGRIRCFLRDGFGLAVKDTVLRSHCACGIPFLGFRVFPHTIRLARRSRARFRRKYNEYERNRQLGIWDEETAARRVEALIAFTRLADSRAYRNSIIGTNR